jgi:hypothetical protein
LKKECVQRSCNCLQKIIQSPLLAVCNLSPTRMEGFY